MKNIVFVFTDNNFARYTSSLIALAVENSNNCKVFGVTDKLYAEENIKSCYDKGYNVVLFTSAAFDNSFVKLMALKYPKTKLAFTSDRFYNMDLSGIKEASLVMPESAVKKYIEIYKNVKFTPFYADLVSCESKKDIEYRIDLFKKFNPEISKNIERMLSDSAESFFLGGRVALENGKFKENTPAIFEKVASDIVKTKKDYVVSFHGLRSFTRGDKVVDFNPVNAFYNTIKNNISEGQRIVMLTKVQNQETKALDSSIREISLVNNRIIDKTTPVKKDIGAAGYYYILQQSIKNGKQLNATVEQMNFIPEALELGAKVTDFKPYNWELSVPSNVDVYRKLFDTYNKDKTVLKNANKAFKDFIKSLSVSGNFKDSNLTLVLENNQNIR